jgi:hypothetical protein
MIIAEIRSYKLFFIEIKMVLYKDWMGCKIKIDWVYKIMMNYLLN